MTSEDFVKFREKYFPGKTSLEQFAVCFGLKFHTVRQYQGSNPNKMPEYLQNSMRFFEEKEQLKLLLNQKQLKKHLNENGK